MVKLYYWSDVINVGDYYAFWLAKKLYKEVQYSTNPNLVITGSILGLDNFTNSTIVWGAGLHNMVVNETCHILNKSNFKAVRGKLTAEKLKLSDVVLGDPGLLASKYFKPKTVDKKSICILAHWRDYYTLKAKYKNKVDIINMATNNVEEILTKINSYEFVLSTSLHGLIFAHSYGIPALYVEATKPESRGYFKFKDYYSSLDIDFNYYKLTFDWENDLQYFNSLNKSTLCPTKTCVETIQNNLLKCLPAESSLPAPTEIKKKENKQSCYLYF